MENKCRVESLIKLVVKGYVPGPTTKINISALNAETYVTENIEPNSVGMIVKRGRVADNTWRTPDGKEVDIDFHKRHGPYCEVLFGEKKVLISESYFFGPKLAPIFELIDTENEQPVENKT